MLTQRPGAVPVGTDRGAGAPEPNRRHQATDGHPAREQSDPARAKPPSPRVPAAPPAPATGTASAGAQMPNFRAESVNAATAWSTCSTRCAADNCTRMRAFPCGTTG